MVKGVIFDLYETLVTQMGVDVPRAGGLGEALGLDANTYRKQWKQLRPRVLRGELTFANALTEIGARLGVDIPAVRIQEACDNRTRANRVVFQNIDHHLVSLARDLRRQGLRLATISNCMAEDVAAWPECVLAPHFDCTVFSFRASATKPDAEIYLEAVRQLGIDPAEALYIGDGGDDELAGAVRAGLRAAQATWFVARDAQPGVPLLADHRDVMRLV